MDQKTIAQWIDQAGGPTAVANQLGVTKQVVHLWGKRNQVGAASVPKFARLVGVPPEVIRPEMYEGA